jgi:hypothetical protein
MNDLELTEHESDRLRELLHRRADRIQVATPQFDVVTPTHDAPRRGNGRWFAAAAAAVVVLAAVGGAWWLSSDGTDRIDTVPAEPTVTVAPQVLEQTGIWRLPEGLDGYTVAGAQDGGSNDVSSATTPGVLAVDDPEDPQRWLMVQAYDELGEVPETARQVQLSDQVNASLIPTDGSTWFQITPTGEPGSDRVVSGSALGFDEVELVELLTEHFGPVDALTRASSSTAPMEAMLADAGFDGANELVWQGDEDTGPGGGNQSIELTLLSDDGTEVVVMLNDSATPAWAQVIRLLMSAELFSMPMADQQPLAMSIRTRSDLGRGVLESSMGPAGQQPAASLTVLTDDGVMINVYPAGMVATPQPIGSLSEEQQLRIINSLRAMPEREFLTRLSELGAEFIGADSMGGTVTTMQGGPGG